MNQAGYVDVVALSDSPSSWGDLALAVILLFVVLVALIWVAERLSGR
jgi:hypothetical protein